MEGMKMARDILVFFLEQLRLLINMKQSVPSPVQKLDSVNMTVNQPMEKVECLTQKCKNLV